MAQNIDNGVIQSQELHQSIETPLPGQGLTPNQMANSQPGNTITATGLSSNTTPITVPPAPTGANFAATVATLNANPQLSGDPLAMYLNESTPPPSNADAYNTAYNNSGVATQQQNVNDLSAQLNNITAQSNVAKQQLESQSAGKDVTSQFLGAQQQEINRQAAIQGLPIAAQLQAAQGNLATAQAHLDTLFKLQSQDATDKYNYNMKLIDVAKQFADKQQQAKLDSQAKQLDYEQQQKMSDINFEHDKLLKQLSMDSWGAPFVQNGAVVQKNGVTGELKVLSNSTNGMTTGETQVSPEVVNRLNLVNTFLDNTQGISGISGNMAQYKPSLFMNDKQNLAKNQYDQLKGQLSLENRKLLKGSGSISDFESRTLEQAATTLSRNLSASDFIDQLVQIQGALQNASGMTATVDITGPDNITRRGMADRATIDEAIKSGGKVHYVNTNLINK